MVQPKKMVEVQIHMSDDLYQKFELLTERRYGDKSTESLSHLLQDIVYWKIDRFDRYGVSLSDRLWLLLLRIPIKWVRARAWAKLIEPYFKED